MADTRLIERWLPIAALGEESVRERRSMTALPPTYYLHVWWARRPLVASRAAVLASLLPADADREKFLQVLGIHGDPVSSRRRIDAARRRGERFEGQAYSYPRAFGYTPNGDDKTWWQRLFNGGGERTAILDPTAGGVVATAIQRGRRKDSHPRSYSGRRKHPIRSNPTRRRSDRQRSESGFGANYAGNGGMARTARQSRQTGIRRHRKAIRGRTRDTTLSILPEGTRRQPDRNELHLGTHSELPILRWSRAALTQLASRTGWNRGQAQTTDGSGSGDARANLLGRDRPYGDGTVVRYRCSRRRDLPLLGLRTCHRR